MKKITITCKCEEDGVVSLGEVIVPDFSEYVDVMGGITERLIKQTIDRQELMKIVGKKNIGSVMAGKPCACGLAWGHTGKHANVVNIACEHGILKDSFCEDCYGAKGTKGLDEEADTKANREHEKLGMFKGKFILQMDRVELLDFAKWAIGEIERRKKKCDHVCSGNCRREGCNCECGYFHVER